VLGTFAFGNVAPVGHDPDHLVAIVPQGLETGIIPVRGSARGNAELFADTPARGQDGLAQRQEEFGFLRRQEVTLGLTDHHVSRKVSGRIEHLSDPQTAI
jgi:hypothetical protein